MNVPLYVVALTTFATGYLFAQVFLGYSLVGALAAMMVVLALQLAWDRNSGSTGPVGPQPLPRGGARPSGRPRHALVDTIITGVFIAITWLIFTNLAPPDAEFLGVGLQDPAPPAAGWMLDLVVVAILLLAGFVGILLRAKLVRDSGRPAG
ncbi:MAG: hypothetical protein ACYDFT_05690 [Thermoplasmata archaeon]